MQAHGSNLHSLTESLGGEEQLKQLTLSFLTKNYSKTIYNILSSKISYFIFV